MEEERKWKRIPRVSRRIPFGYEQDPESPDVLLPIPLELEALELAKKHVKNYSYRQVADWLSGVTGRSITHMGLKDRIERDRTQRLRYGQAKGWSNRLKKAEEALRRLEEESLGAEEKE